LKEGKGMIEQIKPKNDVVPSGDTITALVDELASADGVKRRAARMQLEEIGPAAVPALVKALQSPSEYKRWEAAKALGQIADPRTAPALVSALADTEGAVRWLAATALVNLGRDTLVPLLRGLEGNSNSIWFRDGAHHVLRSLIREGVADEALPVLEALENIEPAVEAPVAAYHVLQDLRGEE
jgi:HEAT repeat protein